MEYTTFIKWGLCGLGKNQAGKTWVIGCFLFQIVHCTVNGKNAIGG